MFAIESGSCWLYQVTEKNFDELCFEFGLELASHSGHPTVACVTHGGAAALEGTLCAGDVVVAIERVPAQILPATQSCWYTAGHCGWVDGAL